MTSFLRVNITVFSKNYGILSRYISGGAKMKKITALFLLGVVIILGVYSLSYGVPSYATSFKSTYPSSPLSSLSTVSGQAGNLCTVCHGASGGTRNTYGSAYAGAGHVFSTIQNADSDGDTFSNITEINAGTFPGNAASKPATADVTAPTVSISAPANGSTFTTAQTVAINATAADAVGVTKVEFYDGATLLGTDLTSPYSFAWAITSAGNGAHSFTAKAYDAAANVGTSAAVGVTVNIATPDVTAPTVSISAPANGATFTTAQTVAINATAADAVGVAKVEFYDGATLLGTDLTSPYSFAWAITSASNGAHSFTAKAYDAAANVGTSAAVGVTVNIATATPPSSSSDKQAPTISSFKLPKKSSSLKVTISSFKAKDNVGVKGYRVSESSKFEGNDWSSTPPSNYTFKSQGSKVLYAQVRDEAGNISKSKSAKIKITLPAGNDDEGDGQSSSNSSSSTKAVQRVVAYDPIFKPVISSDLLKAKPVGVGAIAEDGNILSLEVGLGNLQFPVDAYMTLYSPSESGEPVHAYTLNAENEFKPLVDAKQIWRSGVTSLREVISETPAIELIPGKYMIVFEIKMQGSADLYHSWMTTFTIR